MASYSVNVVADVRRALQQLGDVDKILKRLTTVKNIVVKVPGLKTFDAQIRKSTKLAAEGIKGVAQNTDAITNSFKALGKAANPNAFIVGTFNKANRSAISLLETLSRTTIVLFGINAAFKTLQGTTAKFYNETIGRAEKYYQQLLKTKTTLASTNDVFVNGKKITDPLEKIDSISGLIDSRIDSIRLKTIELAGVTSGEVVEVFSIVASQAGQIGANLEEAEDLAISFAAALGTFGLPLRQARQEITSILQGNINVDSYIAQALQIKSEDIQKARSQIGGVAAYLQKKLSTAVAGQTLAAKTLEGVLSNIRDIYEEFTRNIGDAQLQPLIDAWAFVFETLNKSLKVIKSIGREIGGITAAIGKGLAGSIGITNESGQDKAAAAAEQIFQRIEVLVSKIRVEINDLLSQLQTQLGTIFANIGAISAVLVQSLGELGEAVAILTRAQIESFVGALAQLIPILTAAVVGVGQLIKAWAFFLRQPIVQSIVRIKTTFKVLEQFGVLAVARITTKIILFRKTLMATWAAIQQGLAMAKAGITALMTFISKLIIQIGLLIAQLTAIGLKTGIVSKKAAADLTTISANLLVMGNNAGVAGNKIALLGTGIKGLAMSFRALLSATVILAAVQLAIVGIVEAMSAWQRRQDRIAKDQRIKQAIQYLDDTAEAAANGGLTTLQDKLRALASQEVEQELDDTVAKIREVELELEKLAKRRNAKDSYIDYSLDSDQSAKEKELAALRKKYKELQQRVDKKNIEENVKLEANNRKKLEKEVAEFRKRLADDEFRYRQRLARLEVEKFRLQQQLELKRMEAVLKKRLEGEEGASRVFIENLNNYLRLKKKGEMDIAARQKELVIDIASLQKEIADYKYNVEKKIAELQKKMGIYQTQVADHKLKQARNEAKANSVEGGGYYTQGNTGPTSTGPHFDIKRMDGKFFSRDALDKYVRVNNTDKLSSGTTVKGGEFGASRSYGQHRGWDYAFGQNARLSLTGGAEFVSNKAGGANGDATIFMTPDGTKYQILHGKFTAQPKTDATVAPMPETPDIDLGDTDISGVTNAAEKIKTTMEDIKALKNELTLEELNQAFDNLTEGMFQPVQLEALNDQLDVAKARFNEMATSAQALSEEQRLQIEYQSTLNRAELERDQAIKTVQAESELSDERKAAAIVRIKEAYEKYVEDLKTALGIQQQITGLAEAQAVIAESIANIEAMKNAEEDIRLETRLKLEGLSDTEIKAELKKLAIYRRQAKALKGITDPETRKKIIDQINEEIKAVDALTKTQVNAQKSTTQLMQKWSQDLADVDAYYAQMAQTVQQELGNAMSSAIIGAIDGTKTVQEAFADMFKNIGKAFIDMATQMIAKAIVMKALGILMPGAGNAPSFPQNYYNPTTGLGQAGPNYGLAEGGYVTGPVDATIGEGGQPEYVIPESKMDGAMARWNSGTRGDGVLDPVTGGAAGGDGYSLGDQTFSPNINITGGVMQFGGEDYIKRSELPSIVNQASKSGEERTLRRLRMSPNQRRKIGI